MEEKEQEVKNQLNNFYEAREELYEIFDRLIPKLNESSLYDLEKCDNELIKEIYKKFYKYDYEARKFQPILHKYYQGD